MEKLKTVAIIVLILLLGGAIVLGVIRSNKAYKNGRADAKQEHDFEVVKMKNGLEKVETELNEYKDIAHALKIDNQKLYAQVENMVPKGQLQTVLGFEVTNRLKVEAELKLAEAAIKALEEGNTTLLDSLGYLQGVVVSQDTTSDCPDTKIVTRYICLPRTFMIEKPFYLVSGRVDSNKVYVDIMNREQIGVVLYEERGSIFKRNKFKAAVSSDNPGSTIRGLATYTMPKRTPDFRVSLYAVQEVNQEADFNTVVGAGVYKHLFWDVFIGAEGEAVAAPSPFKFSEARLKLSKEFTTYKRR